MKAALVLALPALALAAPAPAAADDPGRVTVARASALDAAIERHRGATGELPRDAKQLAVVARLYARGVPIPRGAVVDGWNRPFVYHPSPETRSGYRLYSTGENGNDESGGGDDLGVRPLAERGDAKQGVEGAIQLLPVLSLVVVAPIAWAFIRSARRDLR